MLGLVLGCSSERGSLQHEPVTAARTSVVVARQFVQDELKVAWLAKQNQYVTRERKITSAEWQTVLGSVVLQAKVPLRDPNDLLFVEFSKDFGLYYEDYYVLVDPESLRVHAVKYRKWDG